MADKKFETIGKLQPLFFIIDFSYRPRPSECDDQHEQYGHASKHE